MRNALIVLALVASSACDTSACSSDGDCPAARCPSRCVGGQCVAQACEPEEADERPSETEMAPLEPRPEPVVEPVVEPEPEPAQVVEVEAPLRRLPPCDRDRCAEQFRDQCPIGSYPHTDCVRGRCQFRGCPSPIRDRRPIDPFLQ